MNIYILKRKETNLLLQFGEKMFTSSYDLTVPGFETKEAKPS